MSTVAVQETFQRSIPHTPDKPIQTFQKKSHRCITTCSRTSPPPAVPFLFHFVSQLLIYSSMKKVGATTYKISPLKLPLPLHTDQLRLTLTIDQNALNHRKSCREITRGTKESRE